MRQVAGDAVQVVRREDDREAEVVQVVEQVEDVVAGADVDARRRLVHQQQVRIAEQCPGDEHALLLAAGELADVRDPPGPRCRAATAPRAPRPRSARLRHGRMRPDVRAISTHSATVTGKFQLTVSTCGT